MAENPKKLQVYGSFMGPPGKTPVKGVDYWTAEDKAEIVQEVAEQSGAFYVTITGNPNEGYTADKTVAEITEAYEAGRPVFACCYPMDGFTFVLTLTGFFEGVPLFVSFAENIIIATVTDTEVMLNAMSVSEIVNWVVEIPTELPSPGKLTFNGAVSGSYNGSGDVTITIPTIAGEPGKDGYTPVKGVDYFDGAPGYTPVKGTDYWTSADRSAMVSDVLATLPTWNGGSY